MSRRNRFISTCILALIAIILSATLTACESGKDSSHPKLIESASSQKLHTQSSSQHDANLNTTSETTLSALEGVEDEYLKYTWNIELSLVRYSIDHTEYEIKSSTIPNSSGSTSPIIGEFKDGELMAYHGILYTRFSDVYYQYYNFEDFIYMYIIHEKTNAEKFLTADYISVNKYAYQKLKEIKGDDFQLYDPALTTYEKNEYVLVNNNLFLLDHSKKKLVKQNKNENFDYTQLMIEKERILNTDFPF